MHRAVNLVTRYTVLASPYAMVFKKGRMSSRDYVLYSAFNCVFTRGLISRVHPHLPPTSQGSAPKIHTNPLSSPLSPPSGTLNVYCLVEPLVGRLHLSNCLLYLKLGPTDPNPLCVLLEVGVKLRNWHSRARRGGVVFALEVMRYWRF